jgi:high-affinity iron transporter
MLPSFLLSLREGLEAALIIGIVLGVLHKIQRPDLKTFVWGGSVSAIILSIAAAVLLIKLGAELEGTTEEIFEGIAMLLAAGILTWMIFWMRAHADTLKTDLEANVRQATLRSGMGPIFLLAFLSVVREGLELVLFLVAAQMTSDGLQTLFGALIGEFMGLTKRV